MANGKLSYKDNRLKRYKSMTLGIPPPKNCLSGCRCTLNTANKLMTLGIPKKKIF